MSSWTDFFGKNLEFRKGWDISGIGVYPSTPDVGDFYVATSSGTLIDFTFSPGVEQEFQVSDYFFYAGASLGWTFISGPNSTGISGVGAPLNVVYFDGVIKSSPYAATPQDAVVADTASTELTVTLPESPTFGDIISILPATPTFTINKLNIDNNGNAIGGIVDDFEMITNDSIDLIWVGGTVGWSVTAKGTPTLYTDESGVSFYIDLENNGIGHTHQLMITDEEAQSLINGTTVTLNKLSTESIGHSHLVSVQYINGNFAVTNVATNHINFEHTARFVGWDRFEDWIFYDGNLITSPAVSDSFESWLVDTTNAPLTLILPNSPVSNDRVTIVPAAASYATNNLTIDPNGQLINGISDTVTISTNGLAVEFVYQAAQGSWYLIEKGNTLISLARIETSESWFDVSSTSSAIANASYFADSSGGAFTFSLPPSPVNGDSVRVVDATSSATANNITLSGNGETIMGLPNYVLNSNNQMVRFVYSTTHNDWKKVEELI